MKESVLKKDDEVSTPSSEWVGGSSSGLEGRRGKHKGTQTTSTRTEVLGSSGVGPHQRDWEQLRNSDFYYLKTDHGQGDPGPHRPSLRTLPGTTTKPTGLTVDTSPGEVKPLSAPLLDLTFPGVHL